MSAEDLDRISRMSQSLPSSGGFARPGRSADTGPPNVPMSIPTSSWVDWNTPVTQVPPTTAPAPSPAVQYDWDLIMSNFARHVTKVTTDRNVTAAAAIPLTHAALNTSAAAPNGPVSTPMVSPTSERESDDHSVFETAKGLAMISLEATAEPHYIGESSGYLWMTVISKGMHAPKLSNVSNRRSAPSRSPSPSRPSILRTKLLNPLSEDLSKLIIDTVYQHLHSRVSIVTGVSLPG